MSFERVYLENCVEDYFANTDSSDINIEKVYSNFRNTSYDSTGKTSLIESDDSCLDFDKIKDLYIKKHYSSIKSIRNKGLELEKRSMENFKSNDAIKIFEEIEYFIEFKNAPSPKIVEIYEKIKNSLLIYLDITNTTISNTRTNLNYILVYNPDKKEKGRNKVNQHPDYEKIQVNVKGFGNEKVYKFGLKQNLEGLYFKEVLVMTKEEFLHKFNL